MRLWIASIVLAGACAVSLHGQTEAAEGKAWLAASAEKPAMNVTGIWEGGDWGLVSLNQRQGDSRIIGTADGWDLSGVVSGKTVLLLFLKKDKVAFSARLTIDGPKQISGGYAKGLLSAASKTIPLQLKK